MQIIKWQPIKYANELCGVARTHTADTLTPTHTRTHTHRAYTDSAEYHRYIVRGGQGVRGRRMQHG